MYVILLPFEISSSLQVMHKNLGDNGFCSGFLHCQVVDIEPPENSQQSQAAHVKEREVSG